MTNSTQDLEEVKVVVSKIMLQEKGFGMNANDGKATVIADQAGNPYSLRIITHPNGVIGGELVIPRLDTIWERSKSYINRSEVIYEVTVDRKSCLCSFFIRAINARTFEEEFQNGNFLINDNGVIRYVDNNGGCPQFLESALFAALERSKDLHPGRLFFGNIATDGRPIERHWREPRS